jgi:hypothetical protein
MEFEYKYGGWRSTNALRPVHIHEYYGRYWLDMPEGTLETDGHVTRFFNTFDAAKRHAEAAVGFNIKMGELIASAQ